nr:hypothetical protein [Desulforapulum autotrophicum]
MEKDPFSTDDLGGLFVLNEQNDPVKVSDFWRERTAVLVFVRHFG